MTASIIAFLGAIPKILDLMSRLGQLIQDERMKSWMNDLESAISKTEKATQPDEFRSAAKDLVSVIGSL